jgi:uridylate kinase
MRVVLKLGGSVVASPINLPLIREYAALVKQLKTGGHEVAVVVGGGTYAREFIKAAKELGLEENDQDQIAISVSRLFAQILMMKVGRACHESVPFTVEDAARCLKKEGIAIMGGLRPGITTDTVAALVAFEVKAELLIKATDQDGVYDKDPRKSADAVKLDHLSFENLASVFTEDKHKAGIHQIVDPEAIKILGKRHLKVVIVNGFKPDNVLKAIKGEHVGTLVD